MTRARFKRLAGITPIALLLATTGAAPAPGKWISLFDGRTLTGWTPKIAGHDLGDDPLGTFVVRNGAIHVSYDRYDTFGLRFGHLFYKTPFSHYRLQLEYRFVGEDMPDAPAWASRNSGVMIHSQAPETMTKAQRFPVSVETQLLNGGRPGEVRTTANICTPGTEVALAGVRSLEHCVNSSSPTLSGESWVRLEIEVHGDRLVINRVNGKEVIRYEQPRLDPADEDAKPLIAARGGGTLALDSGYIALQSESHPIEFRKIRLQPLPR